eukprot:8145134-Alexandrium_andersonii.AAC.1
MEDCGASLGAGSSQAGQALEPLPLGDQAPEPSAGPPQLQRKRSVRCNPIAKRSLQQHAAAAAPAALATPPRG